MVTRDQIKATLFGPYFLPLQFFLARQAPSDLWTVLGTVVVGWRCVWGDGGEECVVITSVTLQLPPSASSWGSRGQVSAAAYKCFVSALYDYVISYLVTTHVTYDNKLHKVILK